MNSQFVKILAAVALLGGGSAYYYMNKRVKPTEDISESQKKEETRSVENQALEKTPEEPKKEVPSEKSAKIEEVKTQSSTSDEKKDEAPSEDYTDTSIAARIVDLNKNILIKDVKKAANMLPPQMRQVPFKTLYPVLVRQAVDFSVLYHEAIESGFDKKENVVLAIKERTKGIVVSALLDKKSNLLITEEKLLSKYEEYKKMIPQDEKELEIAHILLKTEEEAKTLIKKIQKGEETFEKALDQSLDTQSKGKDGKIGYLNRMEAPKEFFDKALETQDGHIVSVPLKLGKAASVVRVVSRRAVKAPPYEQVKEEIKQSMLPEMSADILKTIKADRALKLYGLDGKEMPERTEEELKKMDLESPSTVDASKLSDDFVCAEFKGGKVTLKDVKENYAHLPDILKSLPLEKIYELLLIRVINERVLLAVAKEEGVDQSDHVKKQQEEESQLIIQEEFLKSKAQEKITETEMKAEYSAISKTITDKNEMEYDIRHIATKTEEEAKKIISDIKSGKKFDDLLDASIDEQSKTKRGAIGFVKKSQLPKDAQDLITKSAVGTLVTKPVKLSDDVYSVMRVEGKQPVTPPSFEQLKERIKSGLTAKKAVSVLEELRSKHKIEYESLKGLPSKDEINTIVPEVNKKMNEALKPS